MMEGNGFLTFPKLRGVTIQPHRQNGHEYYLLQDRLELSEHSLLVPRELAPILALCDGSQEDAHALAATLTQRYGYQIDFEIVQELLQAMDELALLENDHSAIRLREASETYRAQPFRPPISAGLSYPEQPEELSAYLDRLLDEVNDSPLPNLHGQGIFSPHIDYARGGPIYAKTWKQAREMVLAADLVLLVGTDHYGDDPFTLTHQHYATPYGVLPTATPLVDALADALGEGAFAGELRHRREHSLELVAVWLHHMRGGAPCELLPVLTGSFSQYYTNGRGPDSDSQVQRFLEVIREETQGRNLLILASGDMAHVGSAFGGDPLDTVGRAEIAQADSELMDHLQAGDSRAFFSAIKRVQNRHNVCGVTPFYLGMELLGQLPGQITGYASCPADNQNASAVTICGVVY